MITGERNNMKKMAVVPWGADFLNNKMFDLESNLNRDDCLKVWVEIKEAFLTYGWDMNTIDIYSNLNDVDCFLFFYFDLNWYKKLKKSNLEHKAIYVAFEPAVVDINHSNIGMRVLLNYFKTVMTWNDELIDNRRIYKFMYPYLFVKNSNDVIFENKKLLINISGNKESYVYNELYSERKRVIEYYDDNENFSLYGIGWDSIKYKSYKGKADNKIKLYENYKFALCLENMKNVKGYITEKILDCFCAGIVPIYQGASNISEYIPKNCYIDYSSFSSIEELDMFLNDMTKEQYEKYLNEINKYLQSEKKEIFSPDEYVRRVINVYKRMNRIQFSSKSIVIYKLWNYILRKSYKIKYIMKNT